MDFRDTPEIAAWRSTVRDFIGRHLGSERLSHPYEQVGFGGWDVKSDWRRALARQGWLAPAWPREFGGADLSIAQQFVMNEEFAWACAPSAGGLGVALVGPTLLAHGSDEQRRAVLPAILSGESVWCQGFSEPAAGSDLAAVQTRAVRSGDEYVVNGQKIWTTMAHKANWCLLLARTDPAAPKHRGLSLFLLDMASPGLTVRPILDLAGRHHLNELFLDDVHIPAHHRVGDENRGWYAATTTLDYERSSIGPVVANQLAVQDMVAAVRGRMDLGPLKLRIAERAVESAVSRQMAQRVVAMQVVGQVPNVEASVNKLFASELKQRILRTACQTFGLASQAQADRSSAAARYAEFELESIPATIAAGSSEVQRNVIATRGLNLPRG